MAYRVVEGYVYPSNGATLGATAAVLIFLALVAGYFSIGLLADTIQVLLSRN